MANTDTRGQAPPVVMPPPAPAAKNPFTDKAEPQVFAKNSLPDNPYAAPKVLTSPKDSIFPPYDASGDKGLLWALFLFRGRIPRRIYWGVNVLALAIYFAGGGVLTVAIEEQNELLTILTVPIVIIYFWVSLAVQTKRWHDLDKSGWWFFINLIPYIGPLIAFGYLGCTRGTDGPNQYGPDPT